jgi:hypothetical protein
VSRPAFAPGFRLSYFDVAVLVIGSAMGAGLAFVAASACFVVLFVVGHFFLFCNVFRVSRRLELAWGAIFTVLAGATLAADFPGWLITVAISLAITVIVVVLEMRQPSYHGIFWRSVNPQLREWWAKNYRTSK